MGEFIDPNGILHVPVHSICEHPPIPEGWVPFWTNVHVNRDPIKTVLYVRADERQAAEDFFYANAGWSYDPKTETEDQGKRRGARKLARAEKWAQAHGYTFAWIDDPEASQESGHPEYACIMYCKHGGPAQSLWAIGFKGYSPARDPYTRVVQAELALEEMP